MPPPYRVQLINRSRSGEESSRSVDVGPRRSILDAALAQGERLPHACRNGECGSCVARLVAGSVAHPEATVLTTAQRERGFILLCMVAPTSDDCRVEVGLAAQHSMYEESDDG